MYSMTKKDVWGNACWHLFHAACIKLKPERIDLVHDLLRLITTICRNLPCPTCSDHASHIMSGIIINRIKTQSDLITCIYQFHNKVNARIEHPICAREHHDAIYKNAILGKIIQHFITTMNINWPGDRNMLYSMSRNRMLQTVIDFFRKNKDAFN